MTFGTFQFQGHFDALNGAPASGVVHIEGLPNVLVDLAGNKITVGPKAVVLDQLGNFSVSLPVDTTYNGGLRNGFRVTPNLKGLASVGPTEFYAPTPGQTLDYSDVYQQTVVDLTPTGVSQADFDAYVAAHGDGGGGSSTSPGVCNVLDYGAVGNGVAQDGAAILAAINACPVGGTVVIPGGYTFNVAAGQIIVNKKITLAGPGTIAVVSGLDGSGTGVVSGLYITSGGSGTRVQNLHIDNPGDVIPPTLYQNGKNHYGIQIRAHDVLITGCIIESFHMGIAIHQGGEWYRTRIIGNYIKDVLGAGQPSPARDGEDRGDGIVTWGAQTVIANNIVTAKAGDDCRIGIHFEGLPQSQASSPPLQSTQTTITGNIVSGNFRRSIAIEDGDHALISANTVADATWWGIVVTGDAFGTTVTGNTVQWTKPASLDGGAIAWSPTRSAIHILGRLQRCVVSGNVARVVSGAALDAVISIKSNGTNQYPIDNVITGNVVTVETGGVAARGIYLTGGAVQGTKITNNTIKGAFTASGIDAAGITGAYLAEIDGNTIDGIAATAGVRGIIHSVNGTSGVRTVIRNNTIRNFDKGIERYSGVSHMITGNRIAYCNTGIDSGGSPVGALITANMLDSVTTKITGITHGVNGNIVIHNQGVADPVAASSGGVTDWTLATGHLRANIPRNAPWASNLAAVTSGRLQLFAIRLEAGDIVNSIAFMSGGTAMVTPTSQWFELRDPSKVLIAQTADDGTTAWGTNALKSLALPSAYVVPTTGIYYLGIVIIAATVPNLSGVNASVTSGTGMAPILALSSTSALTAKADSPTGAAPFVGFLGQLPYAAVA